MKHNGTTPQWLEDLRRREAPSYRSELSEQVDRLPYWMQQKLRVWLREQEPQEPSLEDTELLAYVKKEVAALLPLVPPDELRRVLQIVRLYAGGR